MYKVIKRIIDFLMALSILILFLMPMIIIAVAIIIDSKGPVIFKQDRTGKNGKIFKMYKFRSMVAENDVHNFKEKDKYTKVGKFIRSLSLDELPQIINILKGEMAFIGPRPWIPEYYENMNKEQRHRCDVLPGITGLAQVKGRNNLSIIEKINYDLEYVRNFSFKQDVKVFFLTIKAIFVKDGVNAGKETIKDELDILKTENGI